MHPLWQYFRNGNGKSDARILSSFRITCVPWFEDKIDREGIQRCLRLQSLVYSKSKKFSSALCTIVLHDQFQMNKFLKAEIKDRSLYPSSCDACSPAFSLNVSGISRDHSWVFRNSVQNVLFGVRALFDAFQDHPYVSWSILYCVRGTFDVCRDRSCASVSILFRIPVSVDTFQDHFWVALSVLCCVLALFDVSQDHSVLAVPLFFRVLVFLDTSWDHSWLLLDISPLQLVSFLIL